MEGGSLKIQGKWEEWEGWELCGRSDAKSRLVAPAFARTLPPSPRLRRTRRQSHPVKVSQDKIGVGRWKEWLAPRGNQSESNQIKPLFLQTTAIRRFFEIARQRLVKRSHSRPWGATGILRWRRLWDRRLRDGMAGVVQVGRTQSRSVKVKSWFDGTLAGVGWI